MAPVTCFPRLAWVRSFPRVSLVTCFPALSPVSCFPALFTGYVFSRSLYQLPVSQPFASTTCFRALGICYVLSRSWHRFLFVFSRLAPVYTCFPALGTVSLFSCTLCWLPPFSASADWSISLLFLCLASCCCFAFGFTVAGYKIIHKADLSSEVLLNPQRVT